MAAASQTGLYPLPGKPVPSYAQTGDIPADKGQNALQAKTIRADAVSRPACAGGYESGTLKCLANPEERLYQYTAIDEYTRLSYLGAYPEQSAYSSADFLEKMVTWFNAVVYGMVLSLPTISRLTRKTGLLALNWPLRALGSGTN